MFKPFKKFNWKAVAILGAIIGAMNYSPATEKYPVAYSLGYGAGMSGVIVLFSSLITKGEKDYKVN